MSVFLDELVLRQRRQDCLRDGTRRLERVVCAKLLAHSEERHGVVALVVSKLRVLLVGGSDHSKLRGYSSGNDGGESFLEEFFDS